MKRWQEPSTYAGAAGLVLAAIQFVPAEYLAEVQGAVYGLAGLFGVLAMSLREKGGSK